jgi:pimeloyl-ACP methyl ester carboxylesterase
MTSTTGARPCLVLLHAFPLWSALYDDVRGPLAETFDLVTPDLRGFGSAPLGEDEPSLDRMADDVAELLDRRGTATAVIGGTSMGGYVAMAFCRRHPDRVAGLVLADTKASADADAAKANRERIAQTALAEGGSRVLLDDVLPGLLGDTTKASRPEVAARVRAWVAQAPAGAAAWAQRAMAARPDSFATLRACDVPAVVVLGAEDALMTRSDAQDMVDALPHGRLVVLPGAGHLTPVETPDAFVSALTRG